MLTKQLLYFRSSRVKRDVDWRSIAGQVCLAVGYGDIAKVSKKNVKIRNKAVNVVEALEKVCGGALGAYDTLVLKDLIALVCLARYIPYPGLAAVTAPCLARDTYLVAKDIFALAEKAGNNLVAICERDYENPTECLMRVKDSYPSRHNIPL